MAGATGLVVDGAFEQVPGLSVSNWYDDPAFRLKMGNDGRAVPGRSVRAFVFHSTRGVPGGSDNRPQRILPGAGPPGGAAEANIRYWTSSATSGGAHILVDFDGQVICTADLVREETYHATSVNHVTVGIEIVQGLTDKPHADGAAPHGYAFFYEKQREVVVTLADWLTRRFRRPRQVHAPYHGSSHPVDRLVHGGADCYGVYQHRDQTSNRGPGDAGDCILQAFLAAGYEAVDFAAGTDKTLWTKRQSDLNLLGASLKVDGIPGLGTMAAVEKYWGKKLGQMVARPGD
jgi:hypothetical protein